MTFWPYTFLLLFMSLYHVHRPPLVYMLLH